MKKITVAAIAVYAVFALATCVSGGTSAGKTVPLDQAIQEAARNIEDTVQAGQKIAVLNFSSPAGQFSEYVIDELSIQLANGKRLVVVDREELDLIWQEEQFQLSGEVSDESALSIGRKLGARLVVTGSLVSMGYIYLFGSLTPMGNAYIFRIRTLAVETAAIKTSYSTNVNPRETRVASLLGGAKPVAIQTAPPGSPAKADGGFVRVEGGTFHMGSHNGSYNEWPVHLVTVKSFSMAKHEVTQKEWFDVMGTTVGQQRDMEDKPQPLYWQGDNYPMSYVNWYEAAEYCNKRSLKEGLTPCYRGSGGSITCDWNANGYRLPTEAEWEYAAKGGNKDFLVYEYSGGNNVDAVAWYGGNSGSTSHAVGTKTPNSLGLHDMSGNVWEWCWDWYESYSGGGYTDPRGPSSGSYRVLRGGGWGNSANDVRSAYRLSYSPNYRYNNIGFRLARNAN